MYNFTSIYRLGYIYYIVYLYSAIKFHNGCFSPVIPLLYTVYFLDDSSVIDLCIIFVRYIILISLLSRLFNY